MLGWMKFGIQIQFVLLILIIYTVLQSDKELKQNEWSLSSSPLKSYMLNWKLSLESEVILWLFLLLIFKVTAFTIWEST